MKKKEVAKLQVIEINKKSYLGEISQSPEGLTLDNAMSFQGGLTNNVMATYIHKSQIDKLTTVKLGNAPYEIISMDDNQVVEFQALAAKFANLMEIAVNNLAAEYARARMGE